MSVKAYLQITMTIDHDKRSNAAQVYTTYKQLFLDTIIVALTKDLLIRDEDVQVLHGFDSVEHAQAYLMSDLFTKDFITKLSPLFSKDPVISIYQVA